VIQAIFNGILFGLLLAVSIGPVFFSLIQTSIQKGFRSGVLLAIGISLSDAICASLSYIGFSQLIENEYFEESLAMGGGIMMLIFGISSIFKKPSNQNSGILIETRKPGTIRFVIKGFALNAVNPTVFLFWVAMTSVASVNENYENSQVLFFLASIILTVFLTDLTKAYVATRLKQYVTFQLMTWLNRVVGVTLFGFGIRLIYYAFKGV
jgi:threonine/homoserine/homoserine lactone efflux protein